MPAPLAYASGKQDALAEGERVLFDYQRPPVPIWRDLRPLVVTLAIGGVATGLAWALFPVETLVPIPTTLLAVGAGVVTFVISCSRFVRHRDRPTLRLTTRRLLIKRSTQFQQLEFEFVRAVQVTSSQLSIDGAETDLDELEPPEADVAAGGLVAIELPDALARGVREGLVAGSLQQRAAERQLRRDARRRWRPDNFADTRADVSLAPDHPPLALLEGEQVVWTGAPTLRLGVDLRHHLVRVLRSTFWIVLAVAAAASGFVMDTRRGPGWWVATILGGLLLLAQFSTFVVQPLKERSRLGRTRYVLTNLRIITFVRVAGRRFSEHSRLIDNGMVTGVEPLDDQRGDIRLDHGIVFERIPNAHLAHQLLLRAIRGLREVGPEALPPMPEPSTLNAIPVDD